ncbi:MAG TPA: hypothetical protein VIY86_04800, partial [Pirellulaceae bacterium]
MRSLGNLIPFWPAPALKSNLKKKTRITRGHGNRWCALRAEPLEERAMLSITTATWANGNLTLVGDAGNDTVIIAKAQASAAVTINSNSVFTLNGTTSNNHALSFVNRLTLRLNDGNDSATLNGLHLTSTSVDLGSASSNQVASIQGSTTGPLTIKSAGSGNTNVSLNNVVSKTTLIDTGDGNDTLAIGAGGGFRTTGNLTIRTDGGQDLVDVAIGGIGTNVGGNL